MGKEFIIGHSQGTAERQQTEMPNLSVKEGYQLIFIHEGAVTWEAGF